MPVSDDLRIAIDKYLQTETAYHLSKRSGVDQSVLSRYLSGERSNLKLETIDRLASALGVKLAPHKNNAK